MSETILQFTARPGIPADRLSPPARSLLAGLINSMRFTESILDGFPRDLRPVTADTLAEEAISTGYAAALNDSLTSTLSPLGSRLLAECLDVLEAAARLGARS